MVQVHHVIHGQYPAFVTACQGVEELGVQFQQLRALIAGSSTLVNDLKRVAQSAAPKVESNENASNQPLIASSKQQYTALDTALEELGVTIAERDFRVVTKLLRVAEEASIEVSYKPPSFVAPYVSLQKSHFDRARYELFVYTTEFICSIYLPRQ